MNSKEIPLDFYQRFQKQLEESQNWPGLYMFKFIVKSNSHQVDKLKDLFNMVEFHCFYTTKSKRIL